VLHDHCDQTGLLLPLLQGSSLNNFFIENLFLPMSREEFLFWNAGHSSPSARPTDMHWGNALGHGVVVCRFLLLVCFQTCGFGVGQ